MKSKNYKDRYINVKYYRLRSPKQLGDNSIISNEEELRRIPPTEKDSFVVETTSNPNFKKVFWVEENEVELIKVEKEYWSAEEFALRDLERFGEI